MILIAYGTRPEWIKIKPLLYELDSNNIKYKTLYTGQHIDLLNDLRPDYKINIWEYLNGNRLDAIISSIINGISINNVFNDISHVLVQGDTTSVLAVALSAFNHGVKIIHLEAGLRTYDNANPYPEEQYRRLVSQITDIHLCPTRKAQENLINERIYGESYVVGNTVLDNLLPYKQKCEYTNKVLVTMHRRENHAQIYKWFIGIDLLAQYYPELEFIFPLHPNPKVQKFKNLLKHVKVVEPMSHDELLNLLVKTKLVITDSGGIQEECSFFNKKCLTCRKVTERPEAIGQSTFLVNSPEELGKIFAEHYLFHNIDYICPFGDGHSAEKIVNILKRNKII